MRTTLSIDEDIARKLRSEAQRRELTFKQIVNETLRRGLLVDAEASSAVTFKVRTRDLGLRPGLKYDDIAGLLDQIEGPYHR